MSQTTLLHEAAPVLFSFQNNPIRTQIDGTTLWFAARDVCEALNIKWTGHSLDAIPAEWKGLVRFTTFEVNQPLRAITEPAVYKLAFRSNKPEADAFTNWIASEIVPSIRKTGKYEAFASTSAPSPISKRTDPERKQLTAIINTWVGMAPVHYASARAQVNAHFGVASVDKLTVAQVKEAIQYVQGKIDALPPAPALPAAALPEAERLPLYRDGEFHLPPVNPAHVPGPREAALHKLLNNWWKREEDVKTAFDAMLHELAECRGDLFTHAMSDMGRNAETFFNPDAMTEAFLCPYYAAETAFRQALHLARVHLKMALNAAVMLHR